MESHERDAGSWDVDLRRHVEARPIVILRLSEDELDAILNSHKGISDFTMAKRHELLAGIQMPCVILIFSVRPNDYLSHTSSREIAYVGVLHSKDAVTTLQTRFKVKRSVLIRPTDPDQLVALISDQRFKGDFVSRLQSGDDLIKLSPRLSVTIMDVLLKVPENRAGLRSVTAGLTRPPAGSMESVQFDAVETAIKAFGLPADSPAYELTLARKATSSLARARVMEDGAIEHDARYVSGFDLIDSDVTGRAIFRKSGQTLEVYTANRKNLEEAFGVDLIYLNLFQDNVVMVQYKMLERDRASSSTDWLYSEDRHLQKQLKAMRLYSSVNSQRDGYRLNSNTFYFKFVRRTGTRARTNVLLPLDHFELLMEDRDFRTRNNRHVKISYDALGGRYMRQSAFFSLLQSGYIGSYASTSKHLRTLVREIASDEESHVLAIQRKTEAAEYESDRKRYLRRYTETINEDEPWE